MHRRPTEREQLRQLASSQDHETALTQVTELAQTTTDPLIHAMARATELLHARNLGRVQRALIVGAELAAAVQALDPQALGDRRDVAILVNGLRNAVIAALDTPEVPIAAIDALLAEHADLLARVGCKPYANLVLLAHRHEVAGERERIPEILETLTPHINYGNAEREHLGCPGCIRGLLASYLEPDTSPEFLAEWLQPVLSGSGIYPNETVKPWQPGCYNSSSHLHLARSLLWHGQLAEADIRGTGCADKDLDPCYLVPTIFYLELAMALRKEPWIRDRIALLRPRALRHEDINEAMLGAVRCAQAMAQIDLGTADERDELWAFARRCAERLDVRLARPRHVAFVEHERIAGPPFMRA